MPWFTTCDRIMYAHTYPALLIGRNHTITITIVWYTLVFVYQPFWKRSRLHQIRHSMRPAIVRFPRPPVVRFSFTVTKKQCSQAQTRLPIPVSLKRDAPGFSLAHPLKKLVHRIPLVLDARLRFAADAAQIKLQHKRVMIIMRVFVLKTSLCASFWNFCFNQNLQIINKTESKTTAQK